VGVPSGGLRGVPRGVPSDEPSESGDRSDTSGLELNIQRTETKANFDDFDGLDAHFEPKTRMIMATTHCSSHHTPLKLEEIDKKHEF
jgi:hypothetical protein